MKQETVIINATVYTGFAKLKDCGIHLDGSGFISDIFDMRRYPKKTFSSNAKIINAAGLIVSPGFIDTHIHGFGGYGTEDLSVESILQMSKKLIDFGVTGFLPTIYTDKLEKMIAGERSIVEAMGKEEGARILGINVEGPFISAKRIGAQNPEGLQEPSIEIFDKIVDEGQGHVVCMTVAPELHNMRDVGLRALKRNVVLLAGHTDASYENIYEGIQCGILHSTHFFNAMSRLHHRNPGTVGAIMIHPEMKCEIIADGYHVHPELIKLLLRQKPLSNIVLITDALKPTQQTEGELLANDVPVILGSQGAFVKKDNPELIEGSALTMKKAVENMTNWGIPLEDSITMACTNPARIYDFKKIGKLIPGYCSDIAIYDKSFNIRGVYIKGKLKVNNGLI